MWFSLKKNDIASLFHWSVFNTTSDDRFEPSLVFKVCKISFCKQRVYPFPHAHTFFFTNRVYKLKRDKNVLYGRLPTVTCASVSHRQLLLTKTLLFHSMTFFFLYLLSPSTYSRPPVGSCLVFCCAFKHIVFQPQKSTFTSRYNLYISISGLSLNKFARTVPFSLCVWAFGTRSRASTIGNRNVIVLSST